MGVSPVIISTISFAFSDSEFFAYFIHWCYSYFYCLNNSYRFIITIEYNTIIISSR
ncbi:hypothetical protein BMB171_C0250 [Bacillus thuringiensis BMB171]|nr:hypothetical protein BMB171_C0250 [Bacillus thuringiensis BMB171]